MDSAVAPPNAKAGSVSLRFNCTKAAKYSSRLLSEPIAAEPGRTYHLSAMAKFGQHGGDRPWIWLVQVDEDGKEIMHLPTGMQLSSSAWSQITCTFVADKGAHSFYIYAGAMPGNYPDNVGLGFWIADVMLVSLDYALSNVIRTSITEIDVTDASSGKKYVFGTDYTVLNATGGSDPYVVYFLAFVRKVHLYLPLDRFFDAAVFLDRACTGPQ